MPWNKDPYGKKQDSMESIRPGFCSWLNWFHTAEGRGWILEVSTAKGEGIDEFPPWNQCLSPYVLTVRKKTTERQQMQCQYLKVEIDGTNTKSLKTNM